MTMIDRIRQLATMGLVLAAGACLHVGLGVQFAMAQTMVPGWSPPFVPKHETTAPGFGLPTSPVVPNIGVDPVLPSPARPHSRTPTAFFPMVPDSRLTFDAAFADDSVAIGGFGLGGFGFGGFGYSGIGVNSSLPPMWESGSGTYRAGSLLPNSAVGMGMGGGDPADPAAGNGGPIPLGAAPEDAFDDAANGRPSATRSVRSSRATSARRPSVRKPTPRPSRGGRSQGYRRGAESAWNWQCAASASQQSGGKLECRRVGRDQVNPEAVHARCAAVVSADRTHFNDRGSARCPPADRPSRPAIDGGGSIRVALRSHDPPLGASSDPARSASG
jgi:hypothetical protein